MIRKSFLIVLVLVGYVYVVASDNDKHVLTHVKAIYNYCVSTFKNMNVEVHINKASLEKYP